jgi:hypothetical protein
MSAVTERLIAATDLLVAVVDLLKPFIIVHNCSTAGFTKRRPNCVELEGLVNLDT